MPIPTRVQIGAHEYRVQRKRKHELPENENGQCEPNDNEIHIQTRLRRSKAQEVLLHEVLHGCTYPTLWDKTLTDEEFIEGISSVLLQVIQDNPELIKYLQEKK